jgi:peptide/nickel transport system permease protein
MIRYIIRRLIGAVFVLFAVSVVTFLIFQLAPAISGNSPVYYYIGKIPFPPGSEQLKALEHRFGFDQPIVAQYWHWLRGILFGQTITDGVSTPVHCGAPCMGYSFRDNTLVSTEIVRALPVSIGLDLGAAFLWLVGGVGIGTISALKKGKFVDRLGMTVALGGVSLPIFFTGPLLLLVFEYKLKWLPNVAYASFFSDPLQWFKSLVLAWIALAFLFAALYARLTRATMLETMSEDYIRTARAKGLSERTVVMRHAFRNALIPIATIVAFDIGGLIGGAVIT